MPLIETIIEGGPLTEDEIREVLAGKKNQPEVKAILSMVEFAIGSAHDESETAGQDRTVRDEACGAARHLRVLRARILDMLPSERRAETED